MNERIKIEDTLKRIAGDVTIEKRIHKGWEEWDKLPQKIKKQIGRKNSIFGKWQYLYESPKGRISLVKLEVGAIQLYTMMWEYAWLIKNSVTTEFPKVIDRTYTKKQAEREIFKLLT